MEYVLSYVKKITVTLPLELIGVSVCHFGVFLMCLASRHCNVFAGLCFQTVSIFLCL